MGLMGNSTQKAILRKTRRAARELALNVIYQCDLGIPFDEALPTALENANLGDLITAKYNTADEARAYAARLAEGIREHRDQLDAVITEFSRDWPIDRQPNVDRNILRIALYEMLYEPDVPDIVSIDEAVELARTFSTDESGGFINGVLAAFLKSRSKD